MEIVERIKNKADELFMRYGIRTVTMDEIANQLGVSKKTIYQHYADKDALVDAVIDDEIQKSTLECRFTRENCTNAVDEIFLAIDHIEKTLSQMNPSVFYDLERFHHRAYMKFQEHKDKFICNMISDNLHRGVAEGLYRPEINIDILSRYRIAGIMMLFNQTVFPASKFPVMDLQREIIEHFLYGVVSEKGYQLTLTYKKARSTKPTHNDANQ